MDATTSTRYQGPVAIIVVVGRVTLAEGVGVMRDAIRQEIKSGYKYILLNLAGVSYIDSAGLGELASAYIAVNNSGGKLKLVHAQQKVHTMLQVTKLYMLLAAYSNEPEALASFGVK
jgi:anti-sigma B factor antagonist